MVRKYFNAEIPEGAHLDVSLEVDGAYRGTLRSDQDNSLVGHLNLVEIPNDDIRSELDVTEEYLERRRTEDVAEVEEETEGGIGAALVGLAFAGLTIAAVSGVANLSSRRQAKRDAAEKAEEAARKAEELKQAREEEEAREAKALKKAKRVANREKKTKAREVRRAENARRAEEATQRNAGLSSAGDVAHQVSTGSQWSAGWYDDGSGSWRWWDGRGWTEHVQPMTVPRHSPAQYQSQERQIMSSEEWQARMQAMLLARAFSDEQWKLLANARIAGADTMVLQAQEELHRITPRQLATRMSLLVDANPSIRQAIRSASPPGWYDHGSDRQRWWNGYQWTEHFRQKQIAGPVHATRPVTPAGWYDDGTGRQRWWDGQRWSN